MVLARIDATICHIIHDRKLLLKKANSGISVGKWNGPGGKIERGETPLMNAVREVDEETGLRIVNPVDHGTIRFYLNGGSRLDYLVYVFSARQFSGKARSSDEGRVRWFEIGKIPYAKMWDDDRYWLPLLLNGVKFDARFSYDRQNRRVIDYLLKAYPPKPRLDPGAKPTL
jgi:8-oxo-dGTP diphosphatase